MKKEVVCGLVGALLLSFGSSAYAQAPIMKISSGYAGNAYGETMHVLEDVNSDGIADLMVAVRPHSPQTYSSSWLEVRSGADGSLLTSGSISSNFHGGLHQVGDLDGDGVTDFAAHTTWSSPVPRSSAQFISGRNATPLTHVWVNLPGHYTDFGHSAAPLSDIDGDHVTDFAVSAGTGVPHAMLYVSGQTGSVIRDIAIRLPQLNLSIGKMISADDQNGDGKSDILVTLSNYSANSQVALFDGQTGALLQQYYANALPGLEFGSDLALLSDIDGDGRKDLAIGARDLSFSSQRTFGAIQVTSSGTGRTLGLLWGSGSQYSTFGRTVKNAGDLSGDGKDDVLTLDQDGFNRVMRVYSSSNGAILLEKQFRSYGFEGTVLGLGDISGDGVADFAYSDAGNPGSGYPGSGTSGYVLIFSGDADTPVGSTCAANGTPRLEFVRSGAQVTLRVSGGTPNASGVLFITAPTELPVRLSAYQCHMAWISLSGAPGEIPFTLDASGSWSITVSIQPGQFLEAAAQAIIVDPNMPVSFDSTNGIVAVIQ